MQGLLCDAVLLRTEEALRLLQTGSAGELVLTVPSAFCSGSASKPGPPQSRSCSPALNASQLTLDAACGPRADSHVCQAC